MSDVPSDHVLEIRVPVTESERELLHLVVEAAIHQYRLYRRGRVSDLEQRAETPAAEPVEWQTHPENCATRGDL